MNRISTFSTFVLFGRTALRRLMNRSQAIKFPSLKKAPPPAPGTPETPAPARSATLHRSQKTPLLRRMLSLWLPMMSLLGIVMLCFNSLFVVIDSVFLDEVRTAKVIQLSLDRYQKLQEAVAVTDQTEREAALDRVFADAFQSPAVWVTDTGKKLARARFDERGVEAFAPLPQDSRWSGTLAYLTPEGRDMALRAVGGYMALVNLTLLCVAFGALSKGLTSADPSLMWLWQLPVSRPVLFTSKLIESVFDTPAAILTSLLYATVLGLSGMSFFPAVAAGTLLGITAAVAAASLRLGAEVLLTQRFSRRVRGAFVALVTGGGGLAMLALMIGSNSQVVVETFRRGVLMLPEWMLWNPLSAGIGTEAMRAETALSWWLAAPVAATAVLALAAVLFSVQMTRNGLASGQDTARDSRRPATAPPAESRTSRFAIGVWKELLQMRRQPEVLGQVLATPLMIVILLYFGGYQKTMDVAMNGGRNISVAILVAAVYMLMIAATQMIGSELKTLWLLQCQPRPLADVIRSKARVWGTIAIGMSLPFLIAAMVVVPGDAWLVLARTPFLLASLWWTAELIFGLTALNATVTNEQTIRFRRGAMLIPALILSDAALALYGDNWWMQVSVLAMLAILSAAVRERQLVELAWLSEPVETPPRRLYAMHGLLAVIGFQSLMGLSSTLLQKSDLLSAAAAVTIAYCVSSLTVVLICWAWLGSNGLTLERSPVRGPVLRPLLGGLAVSCAVGFVVVSALQWLELHSQLPAHVSSDAIRHGSYDKWCLLVLFVVAAPLFEEFVFRGMLFRSLRKSWGILLSVAVTAILFATLHPVVGSVALVTLGATTALAAEKTGRLWPSIAIHAGYNLMIWFLCFSFV